MYNLWLQPITGGRVYLSPQSGGPLKGSAYVPGRGDGQSVDEVIEFTLRGSPGEIDGYLEGLGRLLAQAEREAPVPGGDWVRLCVEDGASGQEWQSLVLGGRLHSGVVGITPRLSGQQACRLELRRADWWDAAQPAPLFKQTLNGGDVAGQPVTLDNHADSQHGNFIDLPEWNGAARNVTGDLPAPLKLHIEPVFDAQHAWTFVTGEMVGYGADACTAVYQAEAGAARGTASGAILPDPGCSGGYYQGLSWSGAADGELWSCDLAAADVKRMGGRAFRPLLRLQEPLPGGADERLWARWKVYRLSGASEYLMHESPAQYVEQNSALVLGPALYLPPWPVDEASPNLAGGLRLALAGSAAGSGAHALKIDFLQLFGLAGWRVYRPLTAEPTRGLLDDPLRGRLTTVTEDYQSHSGEGPGLFAWPGQAQRFWLLGLRHEPAGQAAPIDAAWLVNLTYHPRRRAL